MMLYVLYHTSCADDGIAGIYTTREKAEAAFAKLKPHWVTNYLPEECIEEIEADAEPVD